MNEELIISNYLQSILQVCPKMTEEAQAYFSQQLTVSKWPAKHPVIAEGKHQNQIEYIVEGLIRAYYINDKGDEINVSFIQEGEFAIHYEAFIKRQTSKYHFQCIEPSIVIHIPYEHIWDCCEKFPVMERYLRLILERELIFKQQRIDSFIFENAETRYSTFIQEHPDLFKRLTVSQLSSYLGIERQSLTRIRKKLAAENRE